MGYGGERGDYLEANVDTKIGGEPAFSTSSPPSTLLDPVDAKDPAKIPVPVLPLSEDLLSGPGAIPVGLGELWSC